MLTRILRRLARRPAAVEDVPLADAASFVTRPVTDVEDEQRRAREFWEKQGPSPYYATFKPQTLLLIDRLAAMGARSVFELGCNVGRNLFWIKRTLGAKVAGIDVNASAIDEGHARFGLTAEETRAGSVPSLSRFEKGSFDVAFTVSVLDHLPDPEPALRELLRVAHRLLLVELMLPTFGVVTDPRCVAFSYSHDYDAVLARLPCRVVSKRKSPLGEGLMEHYVTFEVETT